MTFRTRQDCEGPDRRVAVKENETTRPNRQPPERSPSLPPKGKKIHTPLLPPYPQPKKSPLSPLDKPTAIVYHKKKFISQLKSVEKDGADPKRSCREYAVGVSIRPGACLITLELGPEPRLSPPREKRQVWYPRLAPLPAGNCWIPVSGTAQPVQFGWYRELLQPVPLVQMGRAFCCPKKFVGR